MDPQNNHGVVVRDFNRSVDGHVSRLIDSYRLLLQKAVVEDTVGPQLELQLETVSSNVIYHAHALLDKIHELKLELLLDDKSKDDQRN
jgi:hypothetical protein